MATLTAARPRDTLRESATLSATGRVDRQSGTIHGVRVLGFHSSNGRRYTREALAEAKGLYQGVRVFLDHDRTGAERKMNDFVGVLKNVKLTEDGLRGDLQILQEHPQSAVILERAERMPNTLGLSHFANGQTKRMNGELVVTHISEVRSVDLVSDPATSGGLFESRSTLREVAAASERFDIPKDTKSFARWLGGSGNPRTRTPLSDSEQKRRQFLNKIR